MLQAEKIKRTDALREKLEGVENVFLLSFKGVNVPDITRIRSELKKSDAEYIVVKNRLFKRIVEEGNFTDLTEYLTGPTAIVIAKGDPVEPFSGVSAVECRFGRVHLFILACRNRGQYKRNTEQKECIHDLRDW